MANAQSRYGDWFLSRFSESESSFSQSRFVLDVVIPALLRFCMEESINFCQCMKFWICRELNLKPI